MGAPPGFQVWVPFANLLAGATGPQVSVAVQGRRGEGRQGPRLLLRVLYLAPECLYFLFLVE